MSVVALPASIFWPYVVAPIFSQSTCLVDAVNEKFAMIGRVHIDGRPGTSKTLDTTGSSSIQFQTSGACVFDTAGSVFTIGIQGVASGAGPIAQPDGTWAARGVFTQGTNDTTPPLTTGSSWTTAVPTTGSSTISNGDLIAVVFELTTNNGAESVVIAGNNGNSNDGFPVTNSYVGAPAWQTAVGAGAAQAPNVVLSFSDGTLATMTGPEWLGLVGNTSWATGGTDEKGMIFQVPFDCKVSALWARVRTAGATSDFTVTLYSDPSGTPTSLASVTVLAEQYGAINLANRGIWELASEVSLTANTDYCVAVNADGAGNIRFEQATIGNANHRKLFSPAGNTIGATSRSTGAFAAATTTLLYPCGVMISEIQGFGGGGGLKLVGTGGLAG